MSFSRSSALAASVLSIVVGAAVPSPSRADEGMWTFDRFPSRTVAQRYHFAPSTAWLGHVQRASLRIAGGCSASFISPHGLVMTNHHCVVDCVEHLSTQQQNFVESGFVAKSQAEERPCPAFELDQLMTIRDVTAQVQRAVAGRQGQAAVSALNAQRATLQQSCGSSRTVRCDLVSLYHGGVYDLYRYRRYNDVRLVFAPEFDVAQFGGDPDNFNFPRYDFDIGVLRAYDGGRPVDSPDYLRWSATGSRAGDLVFVSGNPGGTSRQLTTAQLAYDRDVIYPYLLPSLAELRGQLEQFVLRGPQQAREARELLFFVENAFKADVGRAAALRDPAFFGMKARDEQRLRAAVAARPRLAAQDASAWNVIAGLQPLRARLAIRANAEDGFIFERGLLGDAVTIVRAAAERRKPNAERLPEYTEQSLVEVREELAAPIPVFKDLDELTLALGLSEIRRLLGADDPFVRRMLGRESPEQLAHRLVTTTHLDDPKVRIALYDGGETAVAASDDPMIRFAAALDPDRRAVRKEFEARIDAPTRAAAERIAKARFAVYGTSVDPDATFTARLSYGAVAGFPDAQGRFVQPYTTMGGLFARATGAPPYALPQRWLDAQRSLDPATPMNLTTTNDIIGGNSGSPLINARAEVVGLIFDGNIFSLGGDYGYDAQRNRAIAVDSRALLAGMRNVYHLDSVVNEIEAARH